MVGGIVDNQEHLIIPIIIIIIILMMVIFMMIIILWVSPLSPFFGFSITKTGHFSGRASGLSRSPGNSGRGRRNGFPQWQWEKSHFWDGKLIPQWNHWYFFWQGDLTCPPSYRTFLCLCLAIPMLFRFEKSSDLPIRILPRFKWPPRTKRTSGSQHLQPMDDYGVMWLITWQWCFLCMFLLW